MIDEAHLPQGLETARHEWGYCLTTYRPDGVDQDTIEGMDWHLQLRHEQLGEAVLTYLRPGGEPPTTLRIAGRSTAHVRHHHKYTDADVRRDRGFHSRTATGRTGAVATNLRRFVDELERCDPGLADRVRAVEASLPDDVEAARARLVAAIIDRYGMRVDRS
ncbi:hypothetical protein BJF90_32475 [Pseudonocardia sp. CNS-004]|nr:hypothetical protein BJF90_32475 [Pseudonocardia sp. CNS-004]